MKKKTLNSLLLFLTTTLLVLWFAYSWFIYQFSDLVVSDPSPIKVARVVHFFLPALYYGVLILNLLNWPPARVLLLGTMVLQLLMALTIVFLLFVVVPMAIITLVPFIVSLAVWLPAIIQSRRS